MWENLENRFIFFFCPGRVKVWSENVKRWHFNFDDAHVVGNHWALRQIQVYVYLLCGLNNQMDHMLSSEVQYLGKRMAVDVDSKSV